MFVRHTFITQESKSTDGCFVRLFFLFGEIENIHCDVHATQRIIRIQWNHVKPIIHFRICIQPENRTYDILWMYFMLAVCRFNVQFIWCVPSTLSVVICYLIESEINFLFLFLSFGVRCSFAWYNFSKIILSVSHYSIFQLLSHFYTVDDVTLPRRVVRI